MKPNTCVPPAAGRDPHACGSDGAATEGGPIDEPYCPLSFAKRACGCTVSRGCDGCGSS